MRLYADDTIVYREINFTDDNNILLEYHDILSELSTIWLMDFNICKCAILPITKLRNASVFIIPSFVILLNALMIMSILGFQIHTIFVGKGIAIRSL